MTIKDLAEVLNIPQSKLKKLCIELLGCIPAQLAPEDEAQIRSAIAQATQALAASGDIPTDIKIHSQNLTVDEQRTAEILGENCLKRLIRDYLTALKNELDSQKFQAESLIFQSEQAFYHNLSTHQQQAQNDSIARIKKNAQFFSPACVKALCGADSGDDLLNEIVELMAVFDFDQ